MLAHGRLERLEAVLTQRAASDLAHVWEEQVEAIDRLPVLSSTRGGGWKHIERLYIRWILSDEYGAPFSDFPR
jgi:hypothetical protein